jgi:hypothetical protein
MPWQKFYILCFFLTGKICTKYEVHIFHLYPVIGKSFHLIMLNEYCFSYRLHKLKYSVSNRQRNRFLDYHWPISDSWKKTQYVELLSWHAVEVKEVYYPEEVTDKNFLNISMYGLVWFMVLNTTFFHLYPVIGKSFHLIMLNEYCFSYRLHKLKYSVSNRQRNRFLDYHWPISVPGSFALIHIRPCPFALKVGPFALIIIYM